MESKAAETVELWHSQYRSPLGWITAECTGSKLSRLLLEEKHDRPSLGVYAPDGAVDAKLAKLLGDHLHAFFQGVQKPFPWKYFDLNCRTEFQLRVLRCCYEIRAGESMSYGQLASVVGNPGAARAVGTVMARNRIPFLIPCHRVIASGGGIGGYSARGGVSTKQWLLDRESGRVAW